MSAARPSEQACLLHRVAVSQADSLRLLAQLRLQANTLTTQHREAGFSNAMDLMRGAIASLEWQLTTAQFDVARLQALARAESREA